MFNRMKIYTVHVKPKEAGVRHRPVFVKEGFNFAAFFFTLLWALYQRLWLVVFVLVIVEIVLLSITKGHMFGHSSGAAIMFGIHLLFGYHANDWVRSRLRRSGYIMADISAADNLLRAEQRYFERYVAAAAQ